MADGCDRAKLELWLWYSGVRHGRGRVEITSCEPRSLLRIGVRPSRRYVTSGGIHMTRDSSVQPAR